MSVFYVNIFILPNASFLYFFLFRESFSTLFVMPATVTELELLADPPLGCISLNDKVIPVCERELESTEPLCVLRAHIDVKPFKDKLLALPAEMWDDDKQEGNVKLVRPAHDAWGIKKIAFTFCDDVSQYNDLPVSQSTILYSFFSTFYSLSSPPYDAFMIG